MTLNQQVENVYKLYPELLKYPLLIKVLLDNRNPDGISEVSQKQIGEKVNLSQTAVSKYLKRLCQHDQCIKKVDKCKYIVCNFDMFKYGSVSKVIAFHNAVINNYNFYSLSLKEQANILGITRDATLIAKHYFGQFILRINDISSEQDLDHILEYNLNQTLKRYIIKM